MPQHVNISDRGGINDSLIVIIRRKIVQLLHLPVPFGLLWACHWVTNTTQENTKKKFSASGAAHSVQEDLESELLLSNRG
jgi:hypothetical protein